MTDFFSQAVAYVLQDEKGFVNDPDDSGGATNFGITRGTLSLYLDRPATVEDVKNLTVETAKLIYRMRYWDTIHLGFITQPLIATVMLDAAVLFGPVISVLYAQKAIKDCGIFKLVVDGFIGPETIGVLNMINENAFLRSFSDVLKARIVVVVASRPSNAKYRDGWENRIEGYLKLIKKGGAA